MDGLALSYQPFIIRLEALEQYLTPLPWESEAMHLWRKQETIATWQPAGTAVGSGLTGGRYYSEALAHNTSLSPEEKEAVLCQHLADVFVYAFDRKVYGRRLVNNSHNREHGLVKSAPRPASSSSSSSSLVVNTSSSSNITNNHTVTSSNSTNTTTTHEQQPQPQQHKREHMLLPPKNEVTPYEVRVTMYYEEVIAVNDESLYADYLRMMQLVALSRTAYVPQSFLLCDTNRDGQLSEGELSAYLGRPVDQLIPTGSEGFPAEIYRHYYDPPVVLDSFFDADPNAVPSSSSTTSMMKKKKKQKYMPTFPLDFYDWVFVETRMTDKLFQFSDDQPHVEGIVDAAELELMLNEVQQLATSLDHPPPTPHAPDDPPSTNANAAPLPTPAHTPAPTVNNFMHRETLPPAFPRSIVPVESLAPYVIPVEKYTCFPRHLAALDTKFTFDSFVAYIRSVRRTEINDNNNDDGNATTLASSAIDHQDHQALKLEDDAHVIRLLKHLDDALHLTSALAAASATSPNTTATTATAGAPLQHLWRHLGVAVLTDIVMHASPGLLVTSFMNDEIRTGQNIVEKRVGIDLLGFTTMWDRLCHGGGGEDEEEDDDDDDEREEEGKKDAGEDDDDGVVRQETTTTPRERKEQWLLDVISEHLYAIAMRTRGSTGSSSGGGGGGEAEAAPTLAAVLTNSPVVDPENEYNFDAILAGRVATLDDLRAPERDPDQLNQSAVRLTPQPLGDRSTANLNDGPCYAGLNSWPFQSSTTAAAAKELQSNSNTTTTTTNLQELGVMDDDIGIPCWGRAVLYGAFGLVIVVIMCLLTCIIYRQWRRRKDQTQDVVTFAYPPVNGSFATAAAAANAHGATHRTTSRCSNGSAASLSTAVPVFAAPGTKSSVSSISQDTKKSKTSECGSGRGSLTSGMAIVPMSGNNAHASLRADDGGDGSNPSNQNPLNSNSMSGHHKCGVSTTSNGAVCGPTALPAPTPPSLGLATPPSADHCLQLLAPPPPPPPSSVGATAACASSSSHSQVLSPSNRYSPVSQPYSPATHPSTTTTGLPPTGGGAGVGTGGVTFAEATKDTVQDDVILHAGEVLSHNGANNNNNSNNKKENNNTNSNGGGHHLKRFEVSENTEEDQHQQRKQENEHEKKTKRKEMKKIK